MVYSVGVVPVRRVAYAKSISPGIIMFTALAQRYSGKKTSNFPGVRTGNNKEFRRFATRSLRRATAMDRHVRARAIRE